VVKGVAEVALGTIIDANTVNNMKSDSSESVYGNSKSRTKEHMVMRLRMILRM
jgi:hypothetical protein